MERISYRWRIIGQLIGLPFSKLESVAKEHHHKPEDCCQSVLAYWLMKPPPDYPSTWQGLIELLEDCQMLVLADDLRRFIFAAKIPSDLYTG